MIETHALTKRFDDFVAVQNITLTVRPGEVLALLGPNGAGKTTTVRMLTSLLRPTSGWARVAGYDIVAEPDQVRTTVGVLTEHHGLYMRMRGAEYLDFFGELYGVDPATRKRRAGALATRFGLADALDRRLGEYSKGMRQKLSLVRAMLHNPRVLLLDEPTSAMDPQSTRVVRDMIKHLRGQERTIILCTHNLAEAEELADRIAIIRRGEIIAQGTSLELKARLLGPPLLELRLARAVEALPDVIADLVELDSYGHNWLRYRTPAPTVTNPRVLRRLAQHGAPVVTLSEVPQSLEDVYLRVIGDDHVVEAPAHPLAG